MHISKTVYECDPDKNTACNKANCYKVNPPRIPGPCHCTSNIAYAKLPIEKTTMVIPVNKEDADLLGIEVPEDE